jgi:hypothetical protein
VYITARELKAALSYILFGVHSCEDLHANVDLRLHAPGDFAFDPASPLRQGELLRELTRLDPALEAHARIDRYLRGRGAPIPPPTTPTARRRVWLGSSNTRRSRHTFRSSTNQIEPMARSPAPISSSTPNGTVTPALRARACSIPTHIRHSQKWRYSRGHKTLSRQQIGLRCLQAQSPVLPERSCPQDPAGSGRRCSRRGPRAP